MWGSDGLIEVTAPVTDDERRDMETHIKGRFGPNLVFQVKSTTYIKRQYAARNLSIRFQVVKNRLISHPLFWYFFAYLDRVAMGFSDPVFIVPSEEVHKHAAPRLDGGKWSFNFQASLQVETHDHWRDYQVSTREVGRHVLHILKTLPAKLKVLAGAAADFPIPPGILWVKTK